MVTVITVHSLWLALWRTRWFKYDRDKLWLVYIQIVPVIFEPPCTSFFRQVHKNFAQLYIPNDRADFRLPGSMFIVQSRWKTNLKTPNKIHSVPTADTQNEINSLVSEPKREGGHFVYRRQIRFVAVVLLSSQHAHIQSSLSQKPLQHTRQSMKVKNIVFNKIHNKHLFMILQSINKTIYMLRCTKQHTVDLNSWTGSISTKKCYINRINNVHSMV